MSEKNQLDPYSPGGCFIATACYGSEFTDQVLLLKDFRDSFLNEFSLGESFIDFYYNHSPPVADFIRENEVLRFVTRVLLVEPFYLISKLVLHLKRS